MIIRDDIVQGSEEWLRAKAGIPSASSFNKVVTIKGTPSKQTEDYAYQLAGEYLLGTVEQGYVSFAMQQGTDRENEARQLYEMINDVEVQTPGVVYKDESRDRLCSPDGLINSQSFGIYKGLEIKCPMLKTHIKYLIYKKLPTDYFCQVQGSLYITGFETYDFMSYYPGLEPFIITVHRDNEWMKVLDTHLNLLNMMVASMIRQIKGGVK